MRTPRVSTIFAVCLASALNLVPAQDARGQIPGLPQITGEQALPAGVTRQGQVEATSVYLDGRALFEIASPAVPDRAQPGALIPVEDRAREVEARLQRVVSPDSGKGAEKIAVTLFTPNTLRTAIRTQNGQPVLVAIDASGPRSEELLSVSDADAQYHGVAARELAERWRQILDRELRSALERRQPEVTRFRLLRLAGILLATLLASTLLGKASTALGKRLKWLKEQRQRVEQAAASQAASSQTATAKATATREGAAPERVVVAAEREERRERNVLSHILRTQFSFTRRHQAIRIVLWVVSWAIVFAWVAAIAGVLYEFPETRGLADRIVAVPAVILIAGFAAGLINGLAGLLIDRITTAWSRLEDPRRSLRAPTVAAALKGLAGAVLYTVAVIAVLEYVLVIPFTVVALGAVIALALSFAAQNLVKDFVNGFLILLEDQYALGDDVQIGDAGGIVERLNLRITQLRGADGRLITIPNHEINRVENKTRLWSRVDLRFTVAPNTDVDRALSVLKRVADETARDPRWRPFVLDAPEVLGVEDISHVGIVIRALIQTLPFKRDEIARDLRRRLKIAFDREGIGLGVPQQAVTIESKRSREDSLPGVEKRESDRRRLDASR